MYIYVYIILYCIYTYRVHVCTKTCFAHITCQICSHQTRISLVIWVTWVECEKHVDFFSRSFRMRSRKRLQRRTRPRRMIVIPLMKSPKRRHQIVTDLKCLLCFFFLKKKKASNLVGFWMVFVKHFYALLQSKSPNGCFLKWWEIPFFPPQVQVSFFVGFTPMGWLGVKPHHFRSFPQICMQVVGRCMFIRRTEI